MNDTVSFAVAEWLKNARQISGLKQDELADKAGISKAYVGHLENARPHNITGVRPSPSAEIIEALARAMNADVDEALLIAGFAPKNASQIPEPIQKIDFALLSDLEIEQIAALANVMIKQKDPSKEKASITENNNAIIKTPDEDTLVILPENALPEAASVGNDPDRAEREGLYPSGENAKKPRNKR